ncbi:MAG: radical SAM protein [Chitinophagaceae bacterium]
MYKFKVKPNEYSDLVILIDFEVKIIEKHNDTYRVSFKMPCVSDLTFSTQIVVLVLAALSNEQFRGIRSGLRELISYLSLNDVEHVSFYKTGEELLLITTIDLKIERIFRLKQDVGSIASCYNKYEFGNLENINTRFEVGRALAPLNAIEYRKYANKIVKAISSNSRELIFTLPPMIVVMGLTDYCNHKCPFCFRQTDPAYQSTDGTIFTSDHLLNLFLDLGESGVLSIRLCGEGEDTLHPNYIVYLLIARVSGINVLQITNGSRLLELAPIVARCISVLRVSINGWTSETYLKKHGIRSSETFEFIISGINAIKHECKRLTFANPVVVLSSVITPDDCLEYKENDLADLYNATGSDFVILKRDLQCSRNSNEQQVRIKEHKLVMSDVNGDENYKRKRDIVGNEVQMSLHNYYFAFSNLEKRCINIIPQAFPHNYIEPYKDVQIKNWITELNLGCILRYMRIEIERLKVFNCSGLHDYYGDLRKSDLWEIWASTTRKEGVTKDNERKKILCEGCGWGDYFSVMNYFFNESMNCMLDEKGNQK